jgi:hypothetical protein
MVDSIVQLPMPTVRIDFTTGGNFSAFYRTAGNLELRR